MAGSLNKVVLIGNLGRDPEIRSTGDGREIANFSVATSETWKDRSTGEKKERTEWHRVVVFSEGLVGVVKNYVKKGSKLYLEGQLQTRKWTDNDGVEKYTTEVVLQNYNSTLILLDNRNSEGGFDDRAMGHSSHESRNNKVSNSGSSFENNELDDEIPF